MVQPRHCKVTYGTDRRAEEEVEETVELERWGEKTELGSDVWRDISRAAGW